MYRYTHRPWRTRGRNTPIGDAMIQHCQVLPSPLGVDAPHQSPPSTPHSHLVLPGWQALAKRAICGVYSSRAAGTGCLGPAAS